MSLINDFINGEYGTVIYNGKTVVIVELNNIRYFRTLNPELYKKLGGSNFSTYDAFTLIASKTFMDYSVVFKNEPGRKTYLYNYGNANSITFEDLFKRFPEVKKKVNMGDIGLPIVKDLIERYVNNSPDRVTKEMIMNHEPLISDIKGSNGAILKFDNCEDYWKLFGYKDYDIRFMENVFSSYGGSVIDSGDAAYNDWNEGYFMYNFDNENLKKIKEILSYINPALNEKLKLDGNVDEKDGKEILEFLDTNFSRQCDDIQSEWVSLNDEAFSKEYEEIIEDENSDYFEKYNIIKLSSFYKYTTPLKNILRLYDEVPGSDNMSLYEVLSVLGEDINKTDDFQQGVYDNGMQSQSFDYVRFNEYVKGKLDDIIEKIKDEWEFTDQTEYFKILNYLQKKGFGFNQAINHPTKKGRQFIILGVDPETNKIKLNMRLDGNHAMKGQKWTFEEFNNYLYHPELFESRKFGKKKI
jgi:hypothetical protein